MKRSPDNQDLTTLLGPSKFSAEGFLGNDTREPQEIIADDLRTLEQLGVSKEKLVNTLKEIYKKSESSLGVSIQINDSCTAEYFDSRGKVPSPFRGDGMFQKGEVQIRDTKSNDTIIITALSINLIERHDFFQGKGSRYRIDPQKIARMFGLTK